MPEWIQILQGLLVPFVAIAGAYIAWQQLAIARVKLQHELFDRRHAIFMSARDLLKDVSINDEVEGDSVWKYRSGISDSVFLLNAELTAYLNEIFDRALKALRIARKQKRAANDKELDTYLTEESEELAWLNEQLPILIEKFKPFLHLEPVPKWPWSKG